MTKHNHRARWGRLQQVSGTILIITLLVSIPQMAVATDGWRTGVGGDPTRSGLSIETGPTGADLLWEGGRPSLVAQQGACENNTLVLSRIQTWFLESGAVIVAHDLTTGQELWTAQLPFDFPATSWRSRVSAVRDGQVYATRAGNTNLDYLYALDVADGSIIWQSEDLIDEGATESLAFAPNGDIIAGNFDSLARISRIDGTTIWQTPRTCPTTNGCQAAVFGDRIYVWEANTGDGPTLAAFDLVSGARLYSSAGICGGASQQIGLFVGPDGTVYAPRTQSVPATDALVAFEDTGAEFVEKWRTPLPYVPFSSFAVGPDGSVYTYDIADNGDTFDLTILRLDPATGSTLDTSPTLVTDSASGQRIAIDAAGKVFLTNGGYSDGALYALDADLTLRWSVPVPGVNVGGPVIGQGGVLVVCGTGNNVFAYQSDTAGDMNCDGALNNLDIPAFVMALLDPNLFLTNYPGCDPDRGDLNGDGNLSGLDLAPFVQTLLDEN